MSVENIIYKSKRNKILRKERHIRYNWEPSPRETAGNVGQMARFHFAIVGNREERENDRNKIYEQLLSKPFYTPLEIIREKTYDIINSNETKVLFLSFDSYMSFKNINLKRLGVPIKRDLKLRERVRRGFTIERYVENFYSRKN
ncbi:MAG: hypothetical protein QXX55_00900 [Candidatus Pacearchaeota archaeon]